MEEKAMTYRALRDQLANLTDAQLDMDVLWTGELRGGKVYQLDITKEDMINPSGDGAEFVSDVREYLLAENMTEAEVDEEIREEPILWAKGAPVLIVDV